ncbi:MAG TPA: tRNA (adenosine(37)-N6)-threonylcarbamoyltransferase complex ATPase subunit type 1 TsaE [Chthoniobacterales bacterium]
MATFISNSPAETEALGRQFAGEIAPGSVVALEGELGAGKTQFTRGIVTGLGSDAAVTSPTFTIVHEYDGGRLPIFHFDFFRLENRERLIQLGLDDYLFGDGVCIVEWADRFADVIPEQARWIYFEMESPERRKIEIR